MPHVKEREPDPQRNPGNSQRARYCSAQPEEGRYTAPHDTILSISGHKPVPGHSVCPIGSIVNS